MSEPIRTCLGCRAKKPKKALRRLALIKDEGLVVFDDQGSRPGRGAWVCRDNPTCLARLQNPGQLFRAFRLKDGPVRLMTG
ncbi:MAG: YlxR family protein [Deltaproteobacteria bacterium]|nr:YlxR family protein [Deltaproteobacteria bacterium]